MPSVTVVDERGQIEEVDLDTKKVAIEVDGGELFKPAAVERIEYDHEGGMSQITHDSCNRTENRRESDKRPDITIGGVLTESQLETAKNLKTATNLTLISDLYSGSIAIKRLTIEQNTDLIESIPDGTGEAELAFEFQLQVKDAQANRGMGGSIDLSGTAAAFLSEAVDGTN